MVDLAPENTISLVDFFRLFQEWKWSGHDACEELNHEARIAALPGERIVEQRSWLARVTDMCLDEAVYFFSQQKLTAFIQQGDRSSRRFFSPKSWREAFFPERFFMEDAIEPGHGAEFDAAVGRTPFVDRREVTDCFGLNERWRIESQSAALMRDVLIGLVMDGAMQGADADRLVTTWRLSPLTVHPIAAYDPRKQPRWTLPMALSWLVWRNVDSVREGMDDYRANCREWFSFHRRLTVAGSKEWYEVWGAELRSLEPLTMFTMGMMEALASDPAEPSTMSVRSARETLWAHLTDGKLEAVGLNQGGNVTPIPAHEWRYIELEAEANLADRLVFSGGRSKPAYHDVTISQSRVLELWPGEDVADSLFDLNEPSWTLCEAAIWVGSEGRRFTSQEIADQDIEGIGAATLFAKLFGEPRLMATGLGPKRTRETIPAEYWELATTDPELYNQRHFVSFIDELLEQDNGGQMTPFGDDKPRWHGIQLQREALFVSFPEFAPQTWAQTQRAPGTPGVPRPSARKLEATKQAIAAVYPNGILPKGLSNKERLDAVNEWLERHGHSPVSISTIERAAKGR